MSIEDSIIYDNIVALANESIPVTKYEYTCELFVDDMKLEALTVNSVDIERDYSGAYYDKTVVEIMVPAGDYMYWIYPHRSRLKMSLSRVYRDSSDKPIDGGNGSQFQIFQANLIDAQSFTMIDYGALSESRDMADKTNLIPLSLQLLDQTIDPMRVTGINGIFHDVTVEELVKVLLRGKATMGSSVPLARGVDIVRCTNTKRYKNVIVPETVELLQLPDYLHQEYGLYGGDVGFYLQGGLWYVYPIAQLDMVNDGRKTLTVVAMPESKMPNAERTFKVKDNQLLLLATGKTTHEDSSDARQRNRGNGIRYLDANRVVDLFSKSVSGKGHIDRSKNLIEYIAWVRDDKLAYAPFLNGGSTANHTRVASHLAGNSGSILQMEWHNSEPTLVIPGMPCRYLYRENGTIKAVKGIVINTTHKSRAINKGYLQKLHSSHSTLSILLEKELK